MKNVHTVNNLNQQLKHLVAEACSYAARSLMRRQKLSEIVRHRAEIPAKTEIEAENAYQY